jgi:hypothetical protein
MLRIPSKLVEFLFMQMYTKCYSMVWEATVG